MFPSLIEGFGFPILEAMAYSTPVITSQNSALSEVAGDAALLIDPRDKSAIAEAMKHVLHPEVRAELVERGTLRTKAFTWQASARNLSTVIDAH